MCAGSRVVEDHFPLFIQHPIAPRPARPPQEVGMIRGAVSSEIETRHAYEELTFLGKIP